MSFMRIGNLLMQAHVRAPTPIPVPPPAPDRPPAPTNLRGGAWCIEFSPLNVVEADAPPGVGRVDLIHNGEVIASEVPWSTGYVGAVHVNVTPGQSYTYTMRSVTEAGESVDSVPITIVGRTNCNVVGNDTPDTANPPSGG